MTPGEKLADWARSQVGYAADADKCTKYGAMLDALGFYNGPKNGFDWCEQFYDAGMVTCFGEDEALAMMGAQRGGGGAGCWISAQDYRDHGRWRQEPEVGAQIYFGPFGDESHTGVVVDYSLYEVVTVEGNTGYSQGYDTGAVLYRTYDRYDTAIVGYGVPDWSLAPASGEWVQDEWGQVQDEHGWWWKRADGTYPADQWERIDGKWYWFDSAGYVVGGWVSYKGDWYYCHDKHDGHFGEMYESTCTKINGETYCFDGLGRMYTGPVPVNQEHDGTFGALRP